MRKKFLGILLFFIIIIVMYMPKVNAVSASMSLSSSSELEEGGTVVVRMNFTDVGTGIMMLVVTLDYDRDVFEEVKGSNFSIADDWNMLGINRSTGMASFSYDGIMDEPGRVATVTLKVKNNINVNSTTIRLTGINPSDGTQDLYTPDTQITIYKTEELEIEQEPVQEVITEQQNIPNNHESDTQTQNNLDNNLSTDNKNIPVSEVVNNNLEQNNNINEENQIQAGAEQANIIDTQNVNIILADGNQENKISNMDTKETQKNTIKNNENAKINYPLIIFEVILIIVITVIIFYLIIRKKVANKNKRA